MEVIMESSTRKFTEVTFKKAEFSGLNFTSYGHGHAFQITTTNDDQILLKFADMADFQRFAEAVLTATLKMDWHKERSAVYLYGGDEVTTVADVIEWRAASEAHDRCDPEA
jgi:hypothetical protein